MIQFLQRAFLALVLILAPGFAPAIGPAKDREEARERAADRAPIDEAGRLALTEPGQLFDYDTTVLVDDLRAIVLIPREGTGTEKPAEMGTIEDRGVGAPADVIEPLKRYIGKPISFHTLNQLMRVVVLGYRNTHRPVVDVFFPEQDITDGVIRIHVVEGVLGEVKVEGAEKTRPEKLTKEIRIGPGEVIRSDVLDEDLRWMNENYFRKVGLIFEEGEGEGESDIVLRVREADSFYAYAGLTNTGVDLTGENEWSAGFLWGNALGTDTLITYNITRDFDFDTLLAHSSYMRAPLPWRHFLEFYGAHLETDVTQSLGPGAVFDIAGVTTQFGLGYVIPLPPAMDGKWTHDFILGVDYISTNNDLAFGGTTVVSDTAVVWNLRGEYEMQLADKSGITALSLAGVYSPGNLTGDNDSTSFNNIRTGAEPDYFYATAELERQQLLPWLGLEARFRLSGQWSNERLITNEQLLLGGYSTVRGFSESVVRGDVGVLANAELYLPERNMPLRLGQKEKIVSVQPYGFYDFGWVDNVDPLAIESERTLSSAGLGLNYRCGDRVHARIEYGWGVQVPDGLTQDQKLHFSVEVRF